MEIFRALSSSATIKEETPIISKVFSSFSLVGFMFKIYLAPGAPISFLGSGASSFLSKTRCWKMEKAVLVSQYKPNAEGRFQSMTRVIPGPIKSILRASLAICGSPPGFGAETMPWMYCNPVAIRTINKFEALRSMNPKKVWLKEAGAETNGYKDAKAFSENPSLKTLYRAMSIGSCKSNRNMG